MSNRVNVEEMLEGLALQFAESIFQAMANSSLDELLAEMSLGPKKAPGVRAMTKVRMESSQPERASASGRFQSTLLAKLRANPNGLRAEQLREALGVDKLVVTRSLRDALAAGAIRKAGQKRATTYFAAE